MTTDDSGTEATVPTKYWHTLDDGRIPCGLCPHACRLPVFLGDSEG